MSGLDVVNSIDNKVKVRPEFIIEVIFGVGTDFEFDGLESGIIIDALADRAGDLTLIAANMFLPEQELSIKVADLNVVVVSDRNFAFSFG